MIYQTKIKLPNYLKYDLGKMAFESAFKFTKGVVITNGSENKIKFLNLILLEIDVIWQYLRLMFDLKAISKGEFQVLSEVLHEITIQIQNWLNWAKKNIKK